MSTIDSTVVLLACSDDGQVTRLPVHSSGHPSEVPVVALPARPDRTAIDPVLAQHEPRRVVVAGTDADLAAVLVRLLRTDRLAVEVAYLPSGPSAAATAWGLPSGAEAERLALTGTASSVPLVRDDGGGVLVGRAEIRDIDGECYCDNVLVLRGTARRLVVVAGPDGIAVRAGWTGRTPDGRVRAVAPRAPRGRGSALGRAVQVGCRPATVVSDGVAHPREVPRWTWYRHIENWLLVRPSTG
ncbi:hypothetical protein [Pseudonocardia xinjiangensis]|uniref:hypothetical protein n=1 Tax=Pseudonocardia xinjiangensis TaxID=75289 RepID=UPI0028A5D585|nr:hypothetical protein [Pseudonocardia xinjiangensis]